MPRLWSAAIGPGTQLSHLTREVSTPNVLVVFFGASCPTSVANIPLYRQLGQRIAEMEEWTLLFVSDGSETATAAILDGEAILASPVPNARFVDHGVWGTPTIALVDAQRHVTHALVGSLTPLEVERLWSALESRSAAHFGQVTEEVTDLDLLWPGEEVVAIDVRPRSAGGSTPGVKRIPLDELGLRLTTEVGNAKRVAIDCTQAELSSCRLASLIVQRKGYSVANVVRRADLLPSGSDERPE